MRIFRLPVGVLVAVLLTWFWSAPISAQRLSAAGNPLELVRLNRVVVEAEVVSSLDKIYLGLGGRRHLKAGTGMLFLMPAMAWQQFCMRGMLIPIDIIWIATDRVVGWHSNLSPQDQGTFTSPGPVNYVLEVPAGFVAQAGIRIGDRVQIGP
ncbi:DUF192 domain-containing protein [Desulfobacca acetoxidans]|uniref:DUF192 domain-containing protein n=1 Tax=Desulfobacca acetoxidans (strain ATCC 700848 / DSM 11109 / ASRB2) TaxID=880072 RepID=F2NFI5_DESAR|nr:DUF192 domain-containing protein [Desulfobacca acetoxidans]AEB10104.1 protein of unknown function DUF192 [Desulfobacca acetoxidans DSM 11109]HAY22900.1 DUF192 domain-containing protein [Desulfobacterales bacterium]